MDRGISGFGFSRSMVSSAQSYIRVSWKDRWWAASHMVEYGELEESRWIQTNVQGENVDPSLDSRSRRLIRFGRTEYRGARLPTIDGSFRARGFSLARDSERQE